MILIGCNLAGGEVDYGTANTTNPTSNSDYLFISHQDIDYLAAKKINFVRLLFSWECLQQSLNSPLANNTYSSDMQDRVAYLTSKGITVLIEPHGGAGNNFAKYKGNLVGSADVPNSAFADFWARVATIYKNNPKVVFGLTNEPSNMSTMQWFGAAQATINAIRSVSATNMIMVPGNGWTNAQSWNDNWYDTATPKVSNATGFKTLTDPGKNLVMSVHMYFDANAGGGADDVVSATIGVERAAVAVNWARANGYKVHFGEFGANAATAMAPAAIKNFMDYLVANQDVVLGCSWWAYGPPTWWGGYRFTLCPTSNYTVDNVKWSWLAPYLATLGPVDTSPTTAPPVVTPPTTTPTYPALAYDGNGFFHVTTGACSYVGYKPDTYDATKPIALFLWMHGCGGNAEGDMWAVCPPATRKTQSYIAISLGGRDGACWNQSADMPKALAALADVQKYFNIDPKKVYLGGYSSGGDMTYYVGMQNADKFAGLLIENSSAWGSGLSVQTLISKASWKVNIAQLNHTSDTTYPMAKSNSDLAALKTAGFPVTAIEKPGGHYDASSGTTGTTYDLMTYLLPFLDKGWVQGGTTTPPVVTPPVVTPPVVTPPAAPTVSNISKTSTTNKAPGAQGLTVKKVVGDGYSNAVKGTYSLQFNTVTTSSSQSTFYIDVIITNDNPDYDVSWESLQLDLRGHTVASFGNCTVSGNTGVVTVTPTTGTAKVLSKNKVAFYMAITRATDATSYYQVLVKSVKF